VREVDCSPRLEAFASAYLAGEPVPVGHSEVPCNPRTTRRSDAAPPVGAHPEKTPTSTNNTSRTIKWLFMFVTQESGYGSERRQNNMLTRSRRSRRNADRSPSRGGSSSNSLISIFASRPNHRQVPLIATVAETDLQTATLFEIGFRYSETIHCSVASNSRTRVTIDKRKEIRAKKCTCSRSFLQSHCAVLLSRAPGPIANRLAKLRILH
jgi:hypothetical protein